MSSIVRLDGLSPSEDCQEEACPAPSLDDERTNKNTIRNVRYMLCSTFSLYVVNAFPLGALFDAYILDVAGGRNTFVGLLESVRGTVKLFIAVPLGWLADLLPKHKLLRFNGLLGTGFACSCAFALRCDSTILFFITVVLWAFHSQTHDGTVMSFVTDCTPEGTQRDRAIAQLQAAGFLGQAVAPALQAILVPIFGANSWGHSELKVILMLGLFGECGVCLPYFLVRSLSLPTSALGSRLNQESQPCAKDTWKDDMWMGWRKRTMIPALIEISQVIVMFGSGVTIKFLPLFFRFEYGFSPVEICILMATLGVATALFGLFVMPYIVRILGRARAAFAVHVAACIAFWVFSFLYDWRFALPLWFLRYPAMNSVTQTGASIVMDCVDENTRGRWAGISSLKAGVWSGSALLGGLLADSTGGYRPALRVTASFHTVAAMVLLPVLFLVPRDY